MKKGGKYYREGLYKKAWFQNSQPTMYIYMKMFITVAGYTFLYKRKLYKNN